MNLVAANASRPCGTSRRNVRSGVERAVSQHAEIP
jgi:hypothetical protein